MKILTRIFEIIFIVLILSSCENKPLSKVNFSNGDYKLYFLIPPGNSMERQTVKLHEKYGNFYISNTNVLEIIKEKIILDKTFGKRSSNSYYFLQLINNEEIVDGAILDLVNNEILNHTGKYAFNVNELEKLNDDFVRLNSFEVNCITIPNINKFSKFIEDSKGFIFNNSSDQKNPIIEFEGNVELKSEAKEIDFSGGFENIQKKFTKDFESLGKIEILRSSYEGGDSITLTMLWQEDFSNDLSNGYRILKPYSDTIDLPVYVYDVEKSEIIQFFENEGITDYRIRELN